MGIGNLLVYNFSISKEEDYTGSVDYDFKSLLRKKQKEKSLMQENPEKYCEYICLKIGHFLKLMQAVELVRMECEFIVDDF